MAAWWSKRLDVLGGVLFLGDLPPQPGDFVELEKLNIGLKPARQSNSNGWSLELAHPTWGSASLECIPDMRLPAREVYECSTLPEHVKNAAMSARTMLLLRMQSRHGHVLRDRKLMLRFLSAVMGQDGVAAIDLQSFNVWTREDMDEELIHDADLDVDGIHQLHAVHDGNGKVFWVHSHGLSEMDRFDFDIMSPSDDLMHNVNYLCRSLAFRILEGELEPSMDEFLLIGPRSTASLVPMERFLSEALPEAKSDLQDCIDKDHIRDHSVVCEPHSRSLLGGLFGKGRRRCEPSRALSRVVPKNPMLIFSDQASGLMADRARKTYPLLRRLHEEFADLNLPFLVKIGMKVDDAEDSLEHMWFEVHGLQDDAVDATLVNQPYYVSHLKEGDRGRHDPESITDWTVLTPYGNLSPSSARSARMVRQNREETRKMMMEDRLR